MDDETDWRKQLLVGLGVLVAVGALIGGIVALVSIKAADYAGIGGSTATSARRPTPGAHRPSDESPPATERTEPETSDEPPSTPTSQPPKKPRNKGITLVSHTQDRLQLRPDQPDRHLRRRRRHDPAGAADGGRPVGRLPHLGDRERRRIRDLHRDRPTRPQQVPGQGGRRLEDLQHRHGTCLVAALRRRVADEDSTTSTTWERHLCAPLTGRKIICAFEVLAGMTTQVARLRRWRARAPAPSRRRCRHRTCPPRHRCRDRRARPCPAADLTDQVRARIYDRRSSPRRSSRRSNATTPKASAAWWVSPVNPNEPLLDRPVFGGRPSWQIGLEDKLALDPILDGVGAARARPRSARRRTTH